MSDLPGGRGGGWVAAQFVLMALILGALFLAPRWPEGAQTVLSLLGAVLALTGGAVAVWAARRLGRSLTPFPKPAGGGRLVEDGPFAVVRHPIYAGGLLFFLGLSLAGGPAALALTVALGVLWALKARVEERHLRARYPGYAAYAARVRRRVVPFVY